MRRVLGGGLRGAIELPGAVRRRVIPLTQKEIEREVSALQGELSADPVSRFDSPDPKPVTPKAQLRALPDDDLLQQSSKEEGLIAFEFETESGQRGVLRLEQSENSIEIENIFLDGPLGADAFGALGFTEVRSVLRELQRAFPQAKMIGGTRVGGARFSGKYNGNYSEGKRTEVRLRLPSPEKIADDLADVRADLPPATRAAVDVIEQDRAARASIRSEFGDSFGAEMARAMEAAEGFAETAGRPQQATFKPSPAPRRSVRRPQSLTEFLAQRGIMDEGGELSAFDLDKLVVPGSGRLVRKEGGLPLDRAREMAAEAGYIHGFGSREDAVANSTVADLIDALHEEQGGKRIFAMGDEIDAEQWRVEGEAIEQHHAREQVRRDIFEASNGVLSEDETARALRLVDGGMDVDEAVERVILYDDTSALEASSDPFEPGGAEFEAQLTALEGQYDPADLISDLMLVDEEGRVLAGARSLEDALFEADRGFDLSHLVEACKLS